MTNQIYVGMDFHKNMTELCFMDSEGKILDRVRIESKKVVQFLSNRVGLYIGIEASGGVFDMTARLKASGHQVSVINPVQFRAIGIGGKKTDRKDAEAIATALRVGFIPSVHQKSEFSRRIRSLLVSRDLIVQQRVGVVCHIRGVLREYGITLAQGKAEFFLNIQNILEELESVAIRNTLKKLLKHAQEFLLQEKEIQVLIEELLKEDERFGQLQSVPGVGPLGAAAFIAAVDDSNRFESGKKIGSYLGLVPRESSSGSKRRLGSITKCGPEMVRRYLIHGARSMISRKAGTEHRNKKWAKKLESRVGINKAAVALAHKNARICLALLRNGTRFGEKKTRLKAA